jgi:oligopeptide/dipeptide ABC transporter ATP-binding protein
MSDYLVEVENLKIHYPVYGGIFRRQIGKVHAVDGISFTIKPGETLGLVGESGCGKTTVGRSVLRLYSPTEGKVLFDGKDLSKLKKRQMQHLRKQMQIIFQDPFESLNSRHTIGNILEEPFLIHGLGTSGERRKEIARLLDTVGLAQNAYDRFPHEFSGGQRQRIGIARAIALNPRLIVCDEPVSALDVSIQSQILNLLIDLQQEMNLTYLFIAHDLAVVKHISDHIAVMYLGNIVEYSSADDLYESPVHPYTHALISAIPIADPTVKRKKQILMGDVPSPISPPSGCVFHTRCAYAAEKCQHQVPQLVPASGKKSGFHLHACLREGEISFS